mgnify:CR=1 FL=1
MDLTRGVSIVIHLRVDNQERAENLRFILSLLLQQTEVSVDILEADTEQRFYLSEMCERLRYRFVKDDDPVFYRTRYLNILLRSAKFPIAGIWDTDVIIPARYLNSFDPQELASHAMADIDPEFVGKVQPGDMIVARKNFGCGSSREHAPLCLKTAGVSCIIAETFARIFFRNAINIGLPIIECKEAAEEIEAGDEVEIDFNSGKIYDRTKGTEYQGQPFPEFMQKIIAAGGLVNYTNQKLKG